jgi:hypothetical protein
VKIEDRRGFVTQVQSDTQGKVSLLAPEGPFDITIEAESIGSSSYTGMAFANLMDAELIASRVFNPSWSRQTPELTLELQENDLGWYYRLRASSELPIIHLLLDVGRTPSSRIINPAVRYDDQADSGWQELDPLLAGYSGEVYVYAVAYDLNRNRSEHYSLLELPGSDNSIESLPVPQLRAALTATTSPALAILDTDTEATVLAQVQWETVDWSELGVSEGNYGFYVYRKEDDIWQRHARVAPFENKWTEGLQLGQEVQYAISSFVAEQESERAETAVLKPLEPFHSVISAPADDATGVSRTPRIHFQYSPQPEGTHVLHRFRIHDDVLGTSSAPSQNIIDQASYSWNEDGRFSGDFAVLKPFRPYRLELTLAYAYQLDEVDTPRAFSIAVDSFGTVIANTFLTGSVNVFETGGE